MPQAAYPTSVVFRPRLRIIRRSLQATLGMEGMVMTMMVTLMILMRMSHGPTGWLSKGKGSKTGPLEDD